MLRIGVRFAISRHLLRLIKRDGRDKAAGRRDKRRERRSAAAADHAHRQQQRQAGREQTPEVRLGDTRFRSSCFGHDGLRK